jgi:hypothetical protein
MRKRSHRLCGPTGIHRTTFALLCAEPKLPRLRPLWLHREFAGNPRAYPQIPVDKNLCPARLVGTIGGAADALGAHPPVAATGKKVKGGTN